MVVKGRMGDDRRYEQRALRHQTLHRFLPALRLPIAGVFDVIRSSAPPPRGAKDYGIMLRYSRGFIDSDQKRRIRATRRPCTLTRSGPKMRVSYDLLAGSSAIEAPRRRNRFRVTSSLSISATTTAPLSAVSLRWMMTVSPSRIPASIMLSPAT